jgi:RNA polymerase sigma factor (sigma-70 family)
MLGLNKISDQQIITDIQQGNEKALVVMYKQNIAMVKNFVRKNSGTDEDVPDLMQDTVIAVWQNANKPNFVLTVKLSTYMMSIAKNLWYKQLRKKSRFTRIDDNPFEQVAVEPKSSFQMDSHIIKTYVNNLDETCRQLLSYFYFDELDNKFIAEKMGFANTDVVKSKKYQCFKKLEKDIKAHYNKEDFFGLS